MRIGIGYDIHRLISGRKFFLGGVLIPFDKGPLGHSDGDCLLHSITDAFLGAAGLGDIGRHFPDTDSRWKDARSEIFLQETHRLLKEKGLKIENIDANIHLEKPKLALYMTEMIKKISYLLDLPQEKINIKAKSGEGLDAVGQGEAVAAQAIALLS